MKERKVVNHIFSKSECISSNELMKTYNDYINDIISSESKNGWSIISCTPVFCNDSLEIIYTMIFEKDDTDKNNDVLVDLVPHIYGYGKEYVNKPIEENIKTWMKDFKEAEKRENEEFINKVKSNDYGNTPEYITLRINKAIDSHRLAIFKNDFAFVPHYAYSEYIKEKGIYIEEPKQITDFIHAVVKLVGEDISAYHYAFYREMTKWNDDKYKIFIEQIGNETYIHIIYFKQLISPSISNIRM